MQNNAGACRLLKLTGLHRSDFASVPLDNTCHLRKFKLAAKDNGIEVEYGAQNSYRELLENNGYAPVVYTQS